MASILENTKDTFRQSMQHLSNSSDWLRWVIAMAIGSAVVYGTTTARLDNLERSMDVHVSAIQQDIRELRAALFRRGG